MGLHEWGFAQKSTINERGFAYGEKLYANTIKADYEREEARLHLKYSERDDVITFVKTKGK